MKKEIVLKLCLEIVDNKISKKELSCQQNNNKNYALAVSINENDTNKMNVVVMEYYFENGQIMVSEIADDNIAKTVTELLQQKLQNNE